MKIKNMSDIQSGYITRGKIEPTEDGSHYLVQAKDVDGERLSYRTDQLIRIQPNLSATSGKAGGLKNVNRSKRLEHWPPRRWRPLT